MQIIYDRVHESQDDNQSDEEKEVKRRARRTKVLVLWGLMQVALVISYILECFEKY